MNLIFLGLSLANTFLLILTTAIGLLGTRGVLEGSWHMQAGLFVALFTCLTHCIIFVYFLGTGRSIREACEEFAVEGDFIRRTKKLKGRTFPFALTGALSILAAAWTGGGVSVGAWTLPSHQTAVWLALAWNALCFIFEFRAVCANMTLLEQLAVYLPDENQKSRPN